MRRLVLLIILISFSQFLDAQLLSGEKAGFTRSDSLKGALSKERISYDVKSYDLSIKVNPAEKYISGSNKMGFVVKKTTQRIQVDLFANMSMDSILFKDVSLPFIREYDAVFVDFPEKLKKSNDTLYLEMFYSGHPIVAKFAPWDGGFVFKKDENGKDYVGVAVQGDGASLWFPCKDHPSDEAEEVKVTLIVPENLVGVSNGRKIKEENLNDGYTSSTWKVTYPINHYNISLYIGDYVHFSDKHGDLDLDYYVLSYNETKAREHFEQVKSMLTCFEDKFGSYPFIDDGYKLIDAPYLGMEHQSAVAYGNEYRDGYLGRDQSSTGLGLTWDFIIVHESGHEWFGNSVSASDIADMWIHESLTTYAEGVYVECLYDKEKGEEYIIGLRKKILNKYPIQGIYGVNNEGSTDMYYKGANMWHTIRVIVDNDELWWEGIRDFTQHFQYQTIDKKQVIKFFSKKFKLNLKSVFDHYLMDVNLPVLEYKLDNKKRLYFRWNLVDKKFRMPVDFSVLGEKHRVDKVNSKWKKTKWKIEDIKDLDFDINKTYIQIMNLRDNKMN